MARRRGTGPMEGEGGGAGDSPSAEYSFSGAVRGKYAERWRDGTNVVLLDPDVAAVFRTSEEVNRFLREHLDDEK